MFTVNNTAITQSIKNLFTKVNENTEFEVMFYNYNATNKLTITKFMNLLNYVQYRSQQDKLELIQETSLDACYCHSINNIYRITVNSIDRINKILNLIHQRKNHVIYSILTSQFYNAEGFEFINKTKDPKNIYDLEQYDIRVRTSQEEEINKKTIETLANLQYTESHKDGLYCLSCWSYRRCICWCFCHCWCYCR